MPSPPGSITRRPMVTDLTTLLIFATVVESQSFSAAAKRLGITPSSVSKHVGQLEERMGVRLLNRTTRRISIREEGRSFYDRCVAILREIEAAEDEIRNRAEEPVGLLRVTAPTVLATRHISPHVTEFMQRYPNMDLEFILTSETLDMVRDGIDLSIRIASRPDPSLRAEKLAPNRRVFCASPAYLAEHGVPETPEDLARHRCLIASRLSPNNSWPWRDRDGITRSVRVHGPLGTNNVDLLRDSLLGGAGIAYVGTFVVGEDLKAGRLVSILEPYTVQTVSFYAVVPHSRYMPRKARVFIDFVKEVFGDPPYWDVAAGPPPEPVLAGDP